MKTPTCTLGCRCTTVKNLKDTDPKVEMIQECQDPVHLDVRIGTLVRQERVVRARHTGSLYQLHQGIYAPRYAFFLVKKCRQCIKGRARP